MHVYLEVAKPPGNGNSSGGDVRVLSKRGVLTIVHVRDIGTIFFFVHSPRWQNYLWRLGNITYGEPKAPAAIQPEPARPVPADRDEGVPAPREDTGAIEEFGAGVPSRRSGRRATRMSNRVAARA